MIKKLKKAFTITELVIVIAVIAILAAVLIPTFANVIENANQSAALQTSTNALTDYQSIALNNDNPKDDDMAGVVFVSDEYAYVYLNSSLHFIGKTSDLCSLNSEGGFTKKDALPGNSSNETGGGLTFDTATPGTTMTATYKEGTEDPVSFDPVALGTLAQGTSGETKTKAAELLYFYSIELNSTTYFGWFTIEVGDNPAYQTQGASYSRVYAYANISTGMLTVSLAS